MFFSTLSSGNIILFRKIQIYLYPQMTNNGGDRNKQRRKKLEEVQDRRRKGGEKDDENDDDDDDWKILSLVHNKLSWITRALLPPNCWSFPVDQPASCFFCIAIIAQRFDSFSKRITTFFFVMKEEKFSYFIIYLQWFFCCCSYFSLT